MKHTEIEAIFTAKVAEFISNGYTINATTMAGSQGEIAKIDFRKGNEIIRVMLATDTEWTDNGTRDMVKFTVGRSTENLANDNRPFDTMGITFWNNRIVGLLYVQPLPELQPGLNVTVHPQTTPAPGFIDVALHDVKRLCRQQSVAVLHNPVRHQTGHIGSASDAVAHRAVEHSPEEINLIGRDHNDYRLHLFHNTASFCSSLGFCVQRTQRA